MASELTKARLQLGQVRGLIRSGKAQPAVMAVFNTLQVVLKTPLLKNEREEFDQLLHDAVMTIANADSVRRLYPRAIVYEQGEEKDLLETLRELLEILDANITDEAQEAKRQQLIRKRKLIEEATEAGEEGRFNKTKEILARAAREFKDDPAYIGEIGEVCVRFRLFEEALVYLEEALSQNPSLAYLYNHIGMILRKQEKFDVAERYYLKASEYLGKDPHLFFNLGRVYVDWGKWQKAMLAANAALKLNPDFDEARKLLNFATRKMEKEE